MRNILFLVIMLCSGSTLITKAQSLQQPATIKLTNASLMHEMRATPSPLDNAIVGDRKISFQWPLQDSYNILETFDATEEDENVIQKKQARKICATNFVIRRIVLSSKEQLWLKPAGLSIILTKTSNQVYGTGSSDMLWLGKRNGQQCRN